MRLICKSVLICFLLLSVKAEAANVAVVAPKVGTMARYGQELIEGVQIAVDMVNDNGGINGEKVNLITVDDRCEDSFAVSAAQMMAINSSVSDKINLVIGPYCNNAFASVADIYSQGKIIRIIPMPLDARQYNTEAAGMVKIGGMMSDEALAFFEFYKNKFVGYNVAMVYHSGLPQTTETAFEVQELFRKNSLSNLTLFNLMDYGDDFSQMAKEILLNNQVVYVLGNPEKTAKLVQELQEEKQDVVVFVDEYLATEYLFRELGNFAEGIYILALRNFKDSPDFAEELVELRLRGKEPKGLGVYGYTAFQIWADIVKDAKSIEFDKMTAVLQDKTFDMPWGIASLNKGNLVPTGGYVIYQIRSGEYTQVY